MQSVSLSVQMFEIPLVNTYTVEYIHIFTDYHREELKLK